VQPLSVTRTSRLALFLTVLASIASAGGCAIATTHQEYRAYRAFRDAADDRERLIAAAQYVQHNPNGMWRTEIQRERDAHEDGVWERSNATREGLEWYLQVYPDGEYAEQARPRLAALQTVEQGRGQQDARQTALDSRRREEQAEAARTWVTRAVTFWTTTLLSVRNYGQPIQRVVEGNAEFNRAFGQPPAPQCAPAYCIKHYGQTYHIPVPGATRIDRHMDLYLRLGLTNGRVERAELILPNKGFSRWYELENRTVVTDEDPEQRNAAINWVLERVQPAIEGAAQGAQRIDYVPEPLAPLQARDDASDTDAAPTAPRKQDDIDDLLDDAVGRPRGQQPQQQQQQQQQAQPEPAGTMVLPTGLLAWRFRGLRVVVFAAGTDDYEQGYDGIMIERIND
jgi:hypothetical protein